MEKGACVPVRVHTVVISLQHSDDVSTQQLRKEIMDKVVKAVIPRQYIDARTVFHIQPSGRFVIGGPQVASALLLVLTKQVRVDRSSSDHCIDAARSLLRSAAGGGKYRSISATGARAACRCCRRSTGQTDGRRTVT